MTKATGLFLFIILLFSCREQTGEYICPPCNLPCDTLTFSKSGICPHCNMELILKSDLEVENLVLNEIEIQEGSGSFLIEGGVGKKEKTIKVFYHKPKNYRVDSEILIVIPGAGRNGDSYRDAWIEESEKYNVVILSPMYSEADYAFEDYHFCGLMSDLNLKESVEYIEGTNFAKMDESKFTFKINSNLNEWIFSDFDRIFDLAVEALNSNQTQYDIFGHSAGGQILHRFVLLNPDSKANRILAGNSGFFTLPDLNRNLPFGLKNLPISEDDLNKSFAKKLVLFLGELDNENETGGTLLRSASADNQGAHRLERGKFFYNFSKSKAEELNAEFNWEIIIVPNVGHNHRRMGDAAGEFSYGKK